MKEDIGYFKGYNQALTDLVAFLRDRQSKLDKKTSIEILENFIQPSINVNNEKIKQMELLMPTQN